MLIFAHFQSAFSGVPLSSNTILHVQLLVAFRLVFALKNIIGMPLFLAMPVAAGWYVMSFALLSVFWAQ
jgi:hypothetical protein